MTKLEAAARQIIVDWDSGIHLYEAITALREALGYCVDEGCPHKGTTHTCVNPLAEQVHTPYCKQAPMCKTPCGNSDCVEQAEHKPVAWWNGKETVWFEHELIIDEPVGEFQIPLYTAPQPVSKEQVAVLDITYGREPECYATPNADDLPEGTYRLYAAPVHPISQELSEREMTMPKQRICECGDKCFPIFSHEREYCETCGWPIYTFDEHRARLLEEQK